MPDKGGEEVKWVCEMIEKKEVGTEVVRGFVGSVNLASGEAEEEILSLVSSCSSCSSSSSSSSMVKGVRWILDCVGEFQEGKTATHIATTRHNGIDYLRGSQGDYQGEVVKEFEKGFKLLQQHNLSFDLQCAPAQLVAGSKLFEKYPGIPVVIDHLGKPRMLLGEDMIEVEGEGEGEGEGGEGGKKRVVNPNLVVDEKELGVWREGMKAMARLPHVNVKISMLGYCVPGWTRTKEREELVKQLVLEVILLFGAERCMVATNWWGGAACSDSDQLSNVGVGAVELLEKVGGWVEGVLGEEEREMLFWGTAKRVYKL